MPRRPPRAPRRAASYYGAVIGAAASPLLLGARVIGHKLLPGTSTIVSQGRLRVRVRGSLLPGSGAGKGAGPWRIIRRSRVL
jgi:hypothetical protein